MEDGTLVFDCFGQSGFGDERGEPYAYEDDDVDVGDDTCTLEQKTATLDKKRETLATREVAAAEAKAKVERVLVGVVATVFGQVEPEPEASEGVPPS